MSKTVYTDVVVPQRVHLGGLTSFKIGGRADNFFLIAGMEELQFFLDKILPFYDGRFHLLGGGSNILVDSKGIKTPVVKLGRGFDYIRRKKNTVITGAATSLASLLQYTATEGLSGLEEFSGIPASVGGLSVMNAGAFGKEFSSLIIKVKVMDYSGQVKVVAGDQIDFYYRGSSLSPYIVLEVELGLKEESPTVVRGKMKEYMRRRFALQDFSFPSAGSVFKNTSKYPAGVLIEKTGLKGLTVGGACISRRHANFIINYYNAVSSDVDYVIELVKERVYHRWGVVLEEEIIKWER